MNYWNFIDSIVLNPLSSLSRRMDLLYTVGLRRSGVETVSYTRNWVCDIALIGCTLSLGKTREGSGFQGEGYKRTMGDKGSQFTSNLGLRWTIPVTAGGSQVSKR